MEIKNKVIILTGASMGIGRAAAIELGKRGAKLALAARSKGALDELAKEIPDAIAIEADMTNKADIERMIHETQKHFGRVDVLVNNAGRGIYGYLENVSADEYKKVFELNVVGPLLAMQKVIPLMREAGGGAIVNISSMVSKSYIPRLSAYASTKYALNALSLTARQELEPDKIVVSVVYPGLTQTDFGKNAVKSGEETRGMESRNRAGLAGDSPEFVAERIAYAIESGDAEVFMHQ